MIRRIVLTASAVALIAVSGIAKSSGDLQCSLTGKKVSSCCCTKAKNGNLHCTLANKDIKECCCKSAQSK